MFKTCKHCNKKFSSIKTCRRHLIKRVCLKRIEKKWQRLKKNMKICERCGIVLSSQYSLEKHLTKQVPCVERDLKHSLFDLQKEYYYKDKIGRKKFQLKKEVLCEKLGININETNLDISLSEKPDIPKNGEMKLEGLSNEELIIKLKEKTELINKTAVWVDIAWELLKEVSPENIIYENPLTPVSTHTPIPSDNESENNVNDTKVNTPVTKKSKSKKKKHLQIISDETLSKEKREWDELLNDYEKTFNPLENILEGTWNTDNFILNPVRHYADYYSRPLMARNMKSSKMLTSIICPHFYPKYKSSLDTKVYININKKRKLWLRDENDKWHSVTFAVGFKNMIFHAVTAFVDMIRREREILPEESVSDWGTEQESLENYHSENNKIVVKNLIKRIPKLSIHPEQEEKKLAEEYLKNDDERIDVLTELSTEFPDYSEMSVEDQETLLYKRIIHNVRHRNKMTKAKGYHLKVNEHYKTYT